MKTIFILLLSASLAFAGGGETKKSSVKESKLGRCSGGANCRACSSCEACKHCSKEGGSCSVCNPDLYNPKPKPAKAKASKPKQSSDTLKVKKRKK